MVVDINPKRTPLMKLLAQIFRKAQVVMLIIKGEIFQKKNGKKEESSEQNKEKGGRKAIQIVQNYDKYIKIKKNK